MTNVTKAMKKIVICVEGWTEFFLISRLMVEWVGYERIHQTMMVQGKSLYVYRESGAPEDSAEIKLLLVNCCSEGKVKPFILERRESFLKRGYTDIIGLQDLFPRGFDKWDEFETVLNSDIGHPLANVCILLQVMECEAWVLNESTHYERIDPRLTIQEIARMTGFNPALDRAENKVAHPSVLLGKIYGIAGLTWRKKIESEVHRTVSALDFDELLVTVRQMSRSLDNFLALLEGLKTDRGSSVTNGGTDVLAY